MYRRNLETCAPVPALMRAVLLAALVSLALEALLAAPTARPASAAPAKAHLLSCTGPCVGITNPLYTAQDQVLAQGPVGAILTVEGANWPPSTTVTIWPAPDAATCAQQVAQPPGFAGTIRVNGIGTAQGTYIWPQEAGGVNQTYTLCAVDGGVTVPPDVQSNGINTYTVLAAEAPSLTVSPKTIVQGQNNSLTVSGQNWLPRQGLTVTVCSDNDCTEMPVASQNTVSEQDGTFQIILPIKDDIKAGSYFVKAETINHALQAPAGNQPPQLTVTTPTPTPTPTPSPTPTRTPTPTPTPPPKSSPTLLIALLGTLSLLFLIGGIISIAIYTRGGG